MAKQNDLEITQVYTFSTGVKVKLNPVSSMTIQAASDSVKIPAPFKQKEAGRNGEIHFVDNPNHQAYIHLLGEARSDKTMAGLRAMIFNGVEMVTPLPESDEWLEDLEMSGVDVGRYRRASGEISERGKVLLYIMHVAAKSPADYEMIARGVTVTEAAVQETVNSF